MAMREAATSVGGMGGGHDVAAEVDLEEAEQVQRHERHDQRALQRRQEAVHREAEAERIRRGRRDEEHHRVDDQREQPEREDDEGEAEKEEYRPDQDVEHAEHERDAEQRDAVAALDRGLGDGDAATFDEPGGVSIAGGKRNYELDRPLVDTLQKLAELEERPQEEIAADLLSAALEQRQVNEANLKTWRALSQREQQVTALVCLNYTNIQIATSLIISKDTVKSHVRSILRKFNVHSKAELRHILAKWDFSDWC